MFTALNLDGQTLLALLIVAGAAGCVARAWRKGLSSVVTGSACGSCGGCASQTDPAVVQIGGRSLENKTIKNKSQTR